MPVIINATPKDPNSNSYATLGEANIYNASVIGAEGWVDFEMDQKNRALVTATRIISSNVRWKGERTTILQGLDWPRYGVYDNDHFYVSSELIPASLKNATAELARRLLESGSTATDTDTSNIKSLKAGPIDITFRDDASAPEPLPSDVFKMIAHLTEQSVSAGVRSVRVIRT